MTLIELLEIIVKKTELNTKQRKDAEQLINELRQANVFGTVAQKINARHECVSRVVDAEYFYGRMRVPSHLVCIYCGRKM